MRKKYDRKMFEQWIQNLESGKFPQTQNTLKGYLKDETTIGFCCLGVFAETNGVFVEPQVNLMGLYTDYLYGNEGPRDVYNWVSKKIPPSVYKKSIEMNDEGEPFESIAKMVRDYLEKYPDFFA